jgi:hypothetical protein
MTVPVAVFAFNRADHLQQTLNALACNYGADNTDVTIFCDGPRNHTEREKTDSVRALARSAQGFRTVTVVEQPHNVGLEKSLIGGISAMLRNSPSVIVVEDDIVTAPHFLRYMNGALECYASELGVASVSGYAYPVSVAEETYFLRDFECWGWGVWRRSWEKMDWDGTRLLAGLRERELEREFDYHGAYPFFAMLRDQAAGRTRSWAIRARANVFLRDELTLYPRRSLTVNIGADGSGTSRSSESEIFMPKHNNGEILVRSRPPIVDATAGMAVAAFLRQDAGILSRMRRRVRRLFD